MSEKIEDLGALFDDYSSAIMHEVEDALITLSYHLPPFTNDMVFGDIKETAKDCWGTPV